MRGTTSYATRVCITSLCLGLASTVLAEEASPPAPRWYDGITINGFASASYTWNLNDPPSKLNQLRAFDYDHNTIRLDGVELVVQKPVVNKGDFGFRVDLAAGAVANVAAARGLFRDPATGKAQDIDLQQAFATYIVPVGRGLRVDVGKFVTPVGYEVIDGYDGYNEEFSRSLAFGYAIPFTHTGLKLNYSFNDYVAVGAMVDNGWDVVVDNNAAKSFGAWLALTPHPTVAINLTYLGGPERDDNNSDFRHLADVVLTWRPTPRIWLAFNFDYGLDQNAIAVSPPAAPTAAAAGTFANAQWLAADLYLRLAATKRLFLNARAELFDDFDGFRTGKVQRIFGATFTPEYHLTGALTVRAEVRYDQSDAHVFEIPKGFRKYQTTVGVNAIYAF